MRKIKFRAWSKEYNQMLNVEDINFRDNIIRTHHFENDRPLQLVDCTEKFKLMQFTGLKDRNGKEIYEGDVVNSIWDFTDLFADEPELGIVNFVVSFDETKAHFLLCPIEDRDDVWKIAINDVVEVVGNIYENPELLEVTQE